MNFTPSNKTYNNPNRGYDNKTHVETHNLNLNPKTHIECIIPYLCPACSISSTLTSLIKTHNIKLGYFGYIPCVYHM